MVRTVSLCWLLLAAGAENAACQRVGGPLGLGWSSTARGSELAGPSGTSREGTSLLPLPAQEVEERRANTGTAFLLSTLGSTLGVAVGVLTLADELDGDAEPGGCDGACSATVLLAAPTLFSAFGSVVAGGEGAGAFLGAVIGGAAGIALIWGAGEGAIPAFPLIQGLLTSIIATAGS